MIDYLVGTGGWGYFNVPNKPRLKAYSEIFNFVEVNNTFYQYPLFKPLRDGEELFQKTSLFQCDAIKT